MKIMAALLTCSLLLLAQLAVASTYAGFTSAPDYTYSYSSGVTSGQESRAGSLTRGAFSYVDANGQEPVRDTPEVARARQEHLEAVARAKALVFGAHAGGATPSAEAVADTPEVAAARSQHLAVVQDARARGGLVAVYDRGVQAVHASWGGVPSTPAPVQDTVEVAAAKAKHLAAVEEAKAKLAASSARSASVSVASRQQAYSSAGSSSSYNQQHHQQAVYSVTASPPSPVQDTVEVAAAKAQHLASVAQAAARVPSSSHSIAAQYAAPSSAPAFARFHYPNVPGDLSPHFPAPAPTPIAAAAPTWPSVVAVRYNTIVGEEDASGRYVAGDEGRYTPSREDAEGQYDPRLDAEGQYDPRLNDEGQYVPSLNDEGQWVPSANEGQYVAGREDQSGEDNMPYSYSYSDGLSSKTETKTADGITRGRFSYVDANGVLQAVEYESDNVNGFRAAGTNLPRPPAGPVAPLAVPSARIYHPPGPSYDAVPAYRAPIAAYAVSPPQPPRPIAVAYAARVAIPAVGIASANVPDVPADTPEVAAAKAAHFAAHREAGARLANAYAGH